MNTYSGQEGTECEILFINFPELWERGITGTFGKKEETEIQGSDVIGPGDSAADWKSWDPTA